ncbi:MAG: TonB-dependent receptor plug domain-containing protein, partial [Gemmatimonadetes bacterium]|nr:TonB-dependent receptor plug domain-containing protein [Gemmatimonadota bacterium]
MKRLLFSALSIFLVGAPVVADDEADTADVYEMGEVIITGSKLPQTPGNVTQKISIITADEMGSLVLGNGNLAEMLSYTPGNFANVLSRNDANWGSSGGLAHTYKGYMLDGLPIDAFVDLQSLDPWAFQRVEDQRGSASVLYPTYLAMDFAGNQSPLAGTANFILKERVGSTRTSASAYYGSYNTIGGRFFHQRAAGNLHLFFGGHHEDSDNTDYGTEGSWLQMDDNPEDDKTKLYMRG